MPPPSHEPGRASSSAPSAVPGSEAAATATAAGGSQFSSPTSTIAARTRAFVASPQGASGSRQVSAV